MRGRGYRRLLIIVTDGSIRRIDRKRSGVRTRDGMWRTLDLAKLIDHLPLGVAVTRRDGRIEYANAHLQGLLDETGDALIGRELAQLRVGGAVNPGAGFNGEEWRGESSFRGRGLLARFLFCLPRSLVGRRRSDPAPSS